MLALWMLFCYYIWWLKKYSYHMTFKLSSFWSGSVPCRGKSRHLWVSHWFFGEILFLLACCIEAFKWSYLKVPEMMFRFVLMFGLLKVTENHSLGEERQYKLNCLTGLLINLNWTSLQELGYERSAAVLWKKIERKPTDAH